MVDDLNAGRPQCPVGLMTLVLPRKGTLGINDKQPFVYIKCGHVHGQHKWGQANYNDGRTCPLCLTVSPFVKLKMGGELSLYVDNEHPTHCFSPCGHMASEKTVKILVSGCSTPWLSRFSRHLSILCHATRRGSVYRETYIPRLYRLMNIHRNKLSMYIMKMEW